MMAFLPFNKDIAPVEKLKPRSGTAAGNSMLVQVPVKAVSLTPPVANTISSGTGALLPFKSPKFIQSFCKFSGFVCSYQQFLMVRKFKLQSFIARHIECRAFAEYSKS